MTEPFYLGDGVYATFDGYFFRLMSQREMTEHVIYVDPTVLDALVAYASRCLELDREAAP